MTLVALCELRSQIFALMSSIAHLLFQGLDLRVGRRRSRLSHLDAAASADSVRSRFPGRWSAESKPRTAAKRSSN